MITGEATEKVARTKEVMILKNIKISWAWQYMPVIPATWEAEAAESPEPGRQRLQSAKLVPLHSSPGDRVRLHLKKKKAAEHGMHACNPNYSEDRRIA